MLGLIRALAGGISAFKIASISAAVVAIGAMAGWGYLELRSRAAEIQRLNRDLGAVAVQRQIAVDAAERNAEALRRAEADHQAALLALTRRAERAEIAAGRATRQKEEAGRARDADAPIPDALMPFTGGGRDIPGSGGDDRGVRR